MSYSEIASAAIQLYLRQLKENQHIILSRYTERELMELPYSDYDEILYMRAQLNMYACPLFNYPSEGS